MLIYVSISATTSAAQASTAQPIASRARRRRRTATRRPGCSTLRRGGGVRRENKSRRSYVQRRLVNNWLSGQLDQRAVGPVERLGEREGDGAQADPRLAAALEVALLVGEHAGEDAALGALVGAERLGGALVEGQVAEQRGHAHAEQRVHDGEEPDGERAV